MSDREPVAVDLEADLSSDDAATRLAAAERTMNAPRTVSPAVLVLAMQDESDEVREAISSVLESYGPPSPTDIAALATALTHANSDVAYWAATLLGRCEHAAAPAVRQLIETVENRAESNVRERAVLALGQIGSAAKSAVATLQQLAESSNGRLQRLAREALSSIQS